MYRSAANGQKFGVESGPYTGAHVFDERDLPPAVRENLHERLGAVTPILAERAPALRVWSSSLTLSALMLLALLIVPGFGALWSDYHPRSPSFVASTTVCSAVLLIATSRLVSALRRRRLSRLPQGTFLFPLDLLVIEGHTVHVRPFGDAREVEADARDRALTLRYKGGEAVRVAGRRGTKARLLTEMLAAQHDLEEATSRGSAPKCDVLADVRVHPSGWPRAAVAPRPQGRAFAALGVALAGTVGAAAGFLGARARIAADDDRMYQAAVSANQLSTYESYLERGVDHAADAHARMEEVAYEEAIGSNYRYQYHRFLTDFADSRHAPEVSARFSAWCVKQYSSVMGTLPLPPSKFLETNYDCARFEAAIREERLRMLELEYTRQGLPLLLRLNQKSTPDADEARFLEAHLASARDERLAAFRDLVGDPSAREYFNALLDEALRAAAPLRISVSLVGPATTDLAQFIAALRTELSTSALAGAFLFVPPSDGVRVQRIRDDYSWDIVGLAKAPSASKVRLRMNPKLPGGRTVDLAVETPGVGPHMLATGLLDLLCGRRRGGPATSSPARISRP